MNPYYYLFYKINFALNKKGNYVLGPIAAITSLLAINFVFLFDSIIKNVYNELEEFSFAIIITFVAIVYIINLVLFADKKRVKKINLSFQGESKKRKYFGNFLVTIYVLLTMCWIFWR
jgi:hypothetical protein